MAIKVFLLGRPGSGKTSVFYNIKKIANKKQIKVHRFREYTILQDMARQNEYKDKFNIFDNGFDILDFSIFNESAKRLEKQIQTYLSLPKEKELIFIELARDDYSKAMDCFSRGFLQNAYFFFIEADIETCIKRIHYRVAHPRKTDGHLVSDDIVKSYYSKNNLPYMNSKFRIDYGIKKKVLVIENTGSSKKFAKLIRYYTKMIFVWEFSTIEVINTREARNFNEMNMNPLMLFMLCLITVPLIFLAIPVLIHITLMLLEIPLFIYLLLILIVVSFFVARNKRFISSYFVQMLSHHVE